LNNIFKTEGFILVLRPSTLDSSSVTSMNKNRYKECNISSYRKSQNKNAYFRKKTW